MRTRSFNLLHVILIIIGLLLILTSATYLFQHISSKPVELDEFPINYIASKNWLENDISPYDSTNGRQVNALFNKTGGKILSGPVEYFHYPLLTTIIFMPFTKLSISTARALWMTINSMLIIIGSVFLTISFHPKPSYILLGMTGVFSLINSFSIQSILTAGLTPIVYVIFCLTVYLIYTHHDQLAGFIFSFAMIDLQISVFVAIFILLWTDRQKRRQFSINFWAGMLFELALAFILLPAWAIGWLGSLIREIIANGIYSSLISQIIGSIYPTGLWLNLGIHLSVLLIIVSIWIRYRGKDWQAFLWGLTLSLLLATIITFPTMPYLSLFCLPALILVIFTWIPRLGKSEKLFFWLAICILFIISWATFIIQNTNEYGLVILFLGLVYPILGIAGLLWIRWWVLRSDLSSKIQSRNIYQ